VDGKPTINLGDENDPITRQIREELKKLDGRAVAKKFTLHGEVVVVQTDKGPVDVPLEVDELRPQPADFRDRHREAMETLYSAVSQIAEKGTRIVPVTRNEMTKQFGVVPKMLKQLEAWGYIRQRVIKLVPKDQPMSTRGQAVAVYYFTPQGRAYVRAEFDPAYGTTVAGAGAEPLAADSEGVQQVPT
jgi:hypothetical protein